MLVSGELAAEGGARRNEAPASRRPPHALLLGFQQQDKGRSWSFSKELPVREAMEFDVVIVGAGPAGLAAAIRLKQLDAHLSVVVLEKGSEVGAHIPSGAVIDPIGLDQLTPEWRTDPEMPLKTLVSKDRYLILTATGGIALPKWPMPRLLGNRQFCRLAGDGRALARQARGIAGRRGISCERGALWRQWEMVGVATGDMDVGRDGKPNHTRGMELRGKYTLLAEGARGSLTKQIAERFRLDEGRDPQKFGIGLKKSCGKSTPHGFSLGWRSTPLAGPLGGARAAARFSITMTTTSSRSGLSFTSTMTIPPCRPSTNSSASRPIRSSSIPSLAEGGSPMAHARSVLRAGNRCRVSRRGTRVSAC